MTAIGYTRRESIVVNYFDLTSQKEDAPLFDNIVISALVPLTSWPAAKPAKQTSWAAPKICAQGRVVGTCEATSRPAERPLTPRAGPSSISDCGQIPPECHNA